MVTSPSETEMVREGAAKYSMLDVWMDGIMVTPNTGGDTTKVPLTPAAPRASAWPAERI